MSELLHPLDSPDYLEREDTWEALGAYTDEHEELGFEDPDDPHAYDPYADACGC